MKRNLCRIVLEKHYEATFKRSTVNNSTIDFYNKDLMVGLQYNSIHHYKYSSKFHKTYRKFKETQKRDIQREQMCKEMGIRLICIPYNSSCVVGMLRRRLKTPNDCRCCDCLNIARLNRPGRAERQRLLDIDR